MRKIFTGLLVCAAALFAGYVGYRIYHVWREDHVIKLAHGFLSKGDRRNALLSLEQALRADRRNVEATRMMAEIGEADRLPGAVIWRSRVVELNPFSLDDRLALVQTAMIMKDYASATNALAGVAASDQNTPVYQNVAGSVAAALGQGLEAEAHFRKAIKLEPQNPVPQFNLAVVFLHKTNDAETGSARAMLANLSSNPTNGGLRCQALRELTLDALRHKDDKSALALSGRLIRETNCVFGDTLLRLGVLKDVQNAGFKQALIDSQREAAQDGGKLYDLSRWKMSNVSPGDTLSWLKSLPVKTQTNQPGALLITECSAMQRDWQGLRDWLKPQNWGQMEFLRHAFASRALRSLNLVDSSKAEWEQALKDANGQKQSLLMLLSLTAQWNWLNEGEELLHAIVNRYPHEEWAMQALMRLYYAGGQTRSMLQYFSQKTKKSPGDLSAKNNLAMTALLLDAQEFKPHELAKDVYQQAPTNASFASTYAFSLYLQKKNIEALKIIEQIKPEDLQKPSIAGYYGLILKANGNLAKARNFLNATSNARLLPEERRLFEKAKLET